MAKLWQCQLRDVGSTQPFIQPPLVALTTHVTQLGLKTLPGAPRHSHGRIEDSGLRTRLFLLFRLIEQDMSRFLIELYSSSGGLTGRRSRRPPRPAPPRPRKILY